MTRRAPRGARWAWENHEHPEYEGGGGGADYPQYVALQRDSSSWSVAWRSPSVSLFGGSIVVDNDAGLYIPDYSTSRMHVGFGTVSGSPAGILMNDGFGGSQGFAAGTPIWAAGGNNYARPDGSVVNGDFLLVYAYPSGVSS